MLWRKVRLAVLSVFLLTLVGALPDILRFAPAPGWWPGPPDSALGRSVFYLALLLLILVIGFWALPRLTDAAFERISRKARLDRVDLVVIPLSLLSDDEVSQLHSVIAAHPRTLEEFVRALPVRHRWIVPLEVVREIQRAGSSPQRVVLIGSPGSNGSHEQAAAFADCLQTLVAEQGAVVHRQSVDFDDIGIAYEELNTVVHDAIGEIARQSRSDDRKVRIVIDVTGGNKQVSIAGAMLTMNNNYVVTYWDGSTLMAYDVRMWARGEL